MTKAIVFDFDGTLADTLPITVSCVNKLADEYGYEKKEIFGKIRNKTMRQIIKDELGLSMIQIPGYLKKLKPLIEREKEKASLFAGIPEVLEELSKKYILFILTSNAPEIVDHVLGENKPMIDFIFSNTSLFGKHKVLQALLAERNLKRDEIVYIGDEVRDIEAAKKLGVKVVAVTWGYNSKKLLEKERPDYLVEKPEEILKILL